MMAERARSSFRATDVRAAMSAKGSWLFRNAVRATVMRH
jgi:hypothetical protein